MVYSIIQIQYAYDTQPVWFCTQYIHTCIHSMYVHTYTADMYIQHTVCTYNMNVFALKGTQQVSAASDSWQCMYCDLQIMLIGAKIVHVTHRNKELLCITNWRHSFTTTNKGHYDLSSNMPSILWQMLNYLHDTMSLTSRNILVCHTNTLKHNYFLIIKFITHEIKKCMKSSFFAPTAHMILRFHLFFVLPGRELFDAHTRNTFKNENSSRFYGISK